MNKILFTLTALVVLFSSSSAQEQAALLKIKGVKGDMGFAWDKYSEMDMDWMKQRTSQEAAFSADLSGMQEGHVFYSSIGANMGGQVLFTAPKLGNELLIPEVRFGVSMLMGKEAIVDFYNNSSADVNSLMYCFVENETRFSGEIVWRVYDQSRVTFYGGVGTNLSASFGNELYVFSNYINDRSTTSNNFQPIPDLNTAENTFDGKSVVYQRLYIPLGLDFKMLRHLQGTVEYKVGAGVEQVVGGDVSTFRTGEFNFGMRFNIERNNTPSILDLF